MIKEYINIKTKESAIKVTMNEISAVRVKDVERHGVRVYDNNKIGISGAIGKVELEVLEQQAIDNLQVNTRYESMPEINHKEHRTTLGKKYTTGDLKDLTEEILQVLRERYPEFYFYHMVKYTETIATMSNTEGLDLSHELNQLDIGFVLKERTSANIMDGFIGYTGLNLDIDKFWTFNHEYIKAYSNKVDLPDFEKMPIIQCDNSIMNMFLSYQFNGENYASKSSIYADQLGEKLFNEKLNLYYSLDPEAVFKTFYDTEGKVLENDKIDVIEKGYLKNVLADKRISKEYNLPYTGGASGDYDSKPELSYYALEPAVDSKDIKKALNGQMAVLVVSTSGGDFTTDGAYAAPVQISFLYDGEKIIGKLPEFTVKSHINVMLGEDYLGTYNIPELYLGDSKNMNFTCMMMSIIR